MHESAMLYGQLFFETYLAAESSGRAILDVGSQNVNGTLRDVAPSSATYVGVDFSEGVDVDIVIDDPYTLPFEDESFDIVVCSSCFEHSEFFWLVVLEILRVLKSDGLLYLNVPSNGFIHRYPVDCWRFYPDAGHAMVNWANRNGNNAVLLESFLGDRAEGVDGHSVWWNDFVAVILKDQKYQQQYSKRMVDEFQHFSNGFSSVKQDELNPNPLPSDFVIIESQLARIEKQQLELSQLTEEVHSLRSERDEILATLDVKAGEAKKLRAALESVRSAFGIPDNDTRELGRLIEARSEAFQRNEAELAGLRNDVQQREADLSALQALLGETQTAYRTSTSWKLTAPLRAAKTAPGDINRIVGEITAATKFGGGIIPTVRKATRVYINEGGAGVKRRINHLRARGMISMGQSRDEKSGQIGPFPSGFVKRGRSNYPSVIFVSHDASMTGAPICLLSLMRWVRKNTDVQFSIIIGEKGPLNRQFEELAPCFYWDDKRADLDSELAEFCGGNVELVYVNSIASGLYAQHLGWMLRHLNPSFVTHVHEMENLFQAHEAHVQALFGLRNEFIAVSPGSVESLRKRMQGEQQVIRLVEPFIEKKDSSRCEILSLADKKTIVGCGTVEHRKGFDIFCDVAVELKRRGRTDFKMLWIGPAPNTDLDPRRLIAEKSVQDCVEWLGSKDYPREYFSVCDIFLLPSREDPFPLVCLEAAECCLPVVCFDKEAGGMHSFVQQDAGVTVPFLDTEAMADAIVALLENEELRERLGARASKKVADKHIVDVAVPKILAACPQINLPHERSEFDEILSAIGNAEAVSFDIFDTLVIRKFNDPRVVFDIIEYKHTEREAAVLPLYSERMETAGQVLASHGGRVDDVSIDEIYGSMGFYVDSEIEKDTEVRLCIPHPTGIKRYEYAKAKNKKVFLLSDMYLDIGTVEKILRNCGISEWDGFYLSSGAGKKKDTGRLFEQFKTDVSAQGIAVCNVVHIGDNWNGDYVKAREAGLNAHRFTPLNERGHKRFTLNQKMRSELSQIGRIWDSFCTQATNLWSEHHPVLSEDFFTRLGFEVTGPLASMMAVHVRNEATCLGIEKIIFMARDGRIIKKAFDRFYAEDLKAGKFESCYLHLSRATVVPATFSNPLTSNDLYFLLEGLHLAQKPITFFLKKAGLDVQDQEVLEVVLRYFKNVDAVPNWGEKSSLASMFHDLSDLIFRVNRLNRSALSGYLEQSEVLGAEKIMLVDVGWLLNIHSRLESFISGMAERPRVVGCYVGSRDRICKKLDHVPLLFGGGDPYVYANYIEKHTTLFELLFSAPEPSAASLTNKADETGVSVNFKSLTIPFSQEFIAAQKLHHGAEAFFEHMAPALRDYFPHTVSRDYFLSLFTSLVETQDKTARTVLGDFEVRLGGHHEFVVRQNLVEAGMLKDNNVGHVTEFFQPIQFSCKDSSSKIVIVTSAGLDNGSTRYRATNFAESLRSRKVSSVLMHSTTDSKTAEHLIASADAVVFQRCFEEQGNVGYFLKHAKKNGKHCVAEIDDLVFPEFVDQIGSVKGGEWDREEALFVAQSYEKLIRQADSCITSTPTIADYVSAAYGLPTTVVRNKVTPDLLSEPNSKRGRGLKLLYSSGTFSHKQDFALIEKILYDFLSQNIDATLSILGATQVSERIMGLSNVSSYSLLPYEEVMYFVSAHDLALVPLADDQFNRAKSNVKFVECGAVGVPVLASRVGEYELAIHHGENGYLADGAQNWYELLTILSENPNTLASVSLSSHLSVKERHTTISIEDDIERILFKPVI